MNMNNTTGINGSLGNARVKITSCIRTLDDDTRVGLTVCHVFVFVAALMANSMVIHVVRTQKKMKISFNFLVVNMAVADMADAVFAIPLNIAYLYVGIQWFPGPFGSFLCKFMNFMVLVSILVSISTLFVITIERYLATTQVLKRPLSLCAVKRVIALIWILAGLVSIYELVRHNVVFLNARYHCMPIIGENWKARYTADFIIKFILTYALPLWTMAILYSIIVCLLWKRKDVGEHNDDYTRKIQQQRRSVIQKLVIIVAMFAVCWLPVHINHFLGTFNRKIYLCLPRWLVLSFYWLAHANSAINPLLYLMLTKNSRALFRSSLTGTKKGEGGSHQGSNKNKDVTKSLISWKRAFKKPRTKVIV